MFLMVLTSLLLSIGLNSGYSHPCAELEIWAECVSPCNTCEELGRCRAPSECKKGCDCKPGYYRNEIGACVPRQQCQVKEQKCPPNAQFVSCGPSVFPTCDDPYPEIDYEEECLSGCFCKPGFLLRRDGICVPERQCLEKELTPDEPTCREDEDYYECNPSCKNTCENFNNPNVKCKCGPPGCFCREGLVRSADGRCVEPQECSRPPTPKVVCREDEDYYECNPSCKNTCENFNNPDVKCECGPPACFCREGLVRNEEGRCVRPQECQRPPAPREPPPKCPKDAIYIECGSPCPPTCEDLEPEPCEEKCVQACYCKPGYLKRKDGICVKLETCLPSKPERPQPKCPEHAIFIECGSPCPPTCENRWPEACEEKCTRACYCKPGYLKSKQGKCVKPEHCKAVPVPVQCGVDEQYYNCTPSCKNTCDHYNNPLIRCKCAPPGCFCKEGLVKRADGKCVHPSQCPKKCGVGEQYYQCTPSCKNTCENFQNPAVLCQCGPPGCFCKEGLVKRADGKCVPPNQCPVKCGIDEQYYQCTPRCKNTCENFRNPAIPCQCGPPGCFCKMGLVKRSDGKCVQPKECPVKCGVDEQYYNCTPGCKNTCENFNNPGVRCRCGLPGCFCREGLVRRADGKCVYPNQCPVQCGVDEQFYNCPPSCKNTCDHYNNPLIRCKCGPPGCFCKEGLVKRADGKCVHPRQCPIKCRSDEQYYQCTPSCKNTCENFFNPGIRCQCGPPGCFCREGLVRCADGTCIPPSQCPGRPSKCQKNAQYLTCGPTCRPTCKNPYTGPCLARCVSGCFCKPGFVEDHNGTCVRLENCNRQCQHPEEEFLECGTTCPDTCENRGRPGPSICPFNCNRGCFCKKGLFRTKEGTCVPLRECPGGRITTVPIYPIRRPSTVPPTTYIPKGCHGCPDRSKCSTCCRNQGKYTGICIGERLSLCSCL
ncbi:zonadhesin [Nephila pilipes]|uniref:Zonadhesin n=1 Tax=Nephila pilipes TaxID=299642 RepID=A0A8X6UK61_NEPPI|nr:zonadhesin [Nephila pilipes]